MYGFARNTELYKRHNVNHFLIFYSNQRDFFRCCCSDDAFNCMFFVLRIIFNLLVWLFRLDGNINSRVILCKLTPAEVMAINYFVGKSKYVKHRVKLFFHAIDSIRLGSLYWSYWKYVTFCCCCFFSSAELPSILLFIVDKKSSGLKNTKHLSIFQRIPKHFLTVSASIGRFPPIWPWKMSRPPQNFLMLLLFGVSTGLKVANKLPIQIVEQ